MTKKLLQINRIHILGTGLKPPLTTDLAIKHAHHNSIFRPDPTLMINPHMKFQKAYILKLPTTDTTFGCAQTFGTILIIDGLYLVEDGLFYYVGEGGVVLVVGGEGQA